MSEQTGTGAAQGTDWGLIGGVCYCAAAVLVAVGLYTMFTYEGHSDGTGHFVEGDAYNYIIIATRGVGWIAAAIVVALMGVGAQLATLRSR